MRSFIFLLVLLIGSSCEKKTINNKDDFPGKINQADMLRIVYSVNNKYKELYISDKLKVDRFIDLNNNHNKLYPEGLVNAKSIYSTINIYSISKNESDVMCVNIQFTFLSGVHIRYDKYNKNMSMGSALKGEYSNNTLVLWVLNELQLKIDAEIIPK